MPWPYSLSLIPAISHIYISTICSDFCRRNCRPLLQVDSASHNGDFVMLFTPVAFRVLTQTALKVGSLGSR